jgi:hypothetical protein
MNCVEFRRHLLTDPQSVAPDFVRHRADCARCADTAARAQGFERDVVRALNVEVPAQLVESILLAQTTAARRRRDAWRRGTVFAAAAALVLAVGLVGMRAEAKPLSVQAVEHLHREADVLGMTRPVPAASVLQSFASRGIALKQVPEGISFVALCPVGKYHTVHLLMPSGDDPVTVIYVADRKVDAVDEFQREDLRGRSAPLGSGTLILLARSDAQFDRIEALWRAAIAG